MAYEIFKRTGFRVDQPSISLVPDGRMAFNAAAIRILTEAGIKAVLLLWDRSTNKVALRAATKGDKNSYAVSVVPDGHSGSLRAKSFLTHIGWSAPKRTMLPTTWNDKDKMFEIILPREHVASTMNRDIPGRKLKMVP
jgi:hypothetical protein